MNAIKFIQDNGVDKAREVVEGAPDRATTVKPSLDFKHFMYGICEEAGGHRIDTNTGVTVITPSGTSKVKGGLTAFIDMGDDSHIENHVSPNCKKFDERVNSNETK